MKKFSLIYFILCASITSAQVLILQHSYEGGAEFFYNSVNRQTNESRMYEDNVDELYGSSYYSELLNGNDSTYTITIYNDDYSLGSSKQFHIPGGRYMGIVSVLLSKATFDDDSNTYEMLVLYKNQNNPTYNYNYYLRLYREDGTLLHDFGTANSFSYSTALHMYGGEYRLWISKKIKRYEYTEEAPYGKDYYYTIYEIYKVNKSVASELSPIPSNEAKCVKVLEDGQVYVIKDGRKYDMRGFISGAK